jgi:hypothetical protein
VVKAYFIGDLRDAAGSRYAPFSEFDIIRGFVRNAPNQWMSGAGGIAYVGPAMRTQPALYYDHVQLWRPDPLPEVLDFCIGWNSLGKLSTSALLADWLLIRADVKRHEDIAALLSDLRKILIDRAPPSGSASARIYGSFPIGLVDTRPLLANYLELDERQIADLLQYCLRASRANDWGTTNNSKSKRVVVLPGTLLFERSLQLELVRDFLTVLSGGLVDLPRPYELALDDAKPPTNRLSEALLTESNWLRMGYVTWLAAQIPHPTRVLTDAAAQRLGSAKPPADPEVHRFLFTLVRQLGVTEQVAIDLLERRLLEAEFEKERRAIEQTLVALGPHGGVAVFRAAARSGAARDVRIPDELWENDRQQQLFPELLLLFDDSTLDTSELKRLVARFPSFESRIGAIVLAWDKSNSQLVKRQAAAVRRAFPDCFPVPGPEYSDGQKQ